MSATAQRYARLMGDFWRHPRTSALSPAAAGVLSRAWSYCADQMTDGAIPAALVPAFFGGAPDAAVIEEMVAAGVWKKTKSGFQIRDWGQRNITREGWAETKAKQNARQEKSRKKRAAVTRDGSVGHASVTRDTGVTSTTVTPPPLDDDDDEDEERTPDPVVVASEPDPRARAPETATTTGALRALHATEAAFEAADTTHSDRLILAAMGAYGRALESQRAIFDGGAAWRTQFAAIGRLAERVAQRDQRELRDVLAEWAQRYVSERKSRRPDWWLERVTMWAAAEAQGTTTDATAKRLEDEDAERAERWRRDELEAVAPPPEAAGIAAILRGDVQPAPRAKSADEVHAERQLQMDHQRAAYVAKHGGRT